MPTPRLVAGTNAAIWSRVRSSKMVDTSDSAGPGLIREWIERAAQLHPDKPYIVSVEDGRVITFGEFARLVRRIGSFLARAEIVTNDRVALFANNSIGHIACHIGVMAYGATICTVHVEMNRRHLGRIMAQLKPRLALYDDDLIGEVTSASDNIRNGALISIESGLRPDGAGDSPPPCGEGADAAQRRPIAPPVRCL